MLKEMAGSFKKSFEDILNFGENRLNFAGIGKIDDDVGKNISEELQNPNININKASNSGSGVEIINFGENRLNFAGIGKIDDDVGKNISEELQNPNININKASNSGSGVEISNSKINNKKPYKIKAINGDDLNKIEFLKIDINKDKLIEKITDKENKQAHIFSNEHISGKNNNNIGFNTLQIDLNMSEEDMKKYVKNHISKIL